MRRENFTTKYIAAILSPPRAQYVSLHGMYAQCRMCGDSVSEACAVAVLRATSVPNGSAFADKTLD